MIEPLVLALDPGPEMTAYVLLFGDRPLVSGKVANEHMRREVGKHAVDAVVIERVASYGMPVGDEVFETVYWTGRYTEAALIAGLPVHRVTRMAVKLHLCGQARAKDANVRQALLDRYGGKDKAVGRKASPGPLYDITGDMWAALAVGLTWIDTEGGKP